MSEDKKSERHDIPVAEMLAACGLSLAETTTLLGLERATVNKKVVGERKPTAGDLEKLRGVYKDILAGGGADLPEGARRMIEALRYLRGEIDLPEEKRGRKPKASGGSGGAPVSEARRPTSPGVYVVRALQPSSHLWDEDPIAGQEMEIYDWIIKVEGWARYWARREELRQRDIREIERRWEAERQRKERLRLGKERRAAARAAAGAEVTHA